MRRALAALWECLPELAGNALLVFYAATAVAGIAFAIYVLV